MAFPTGWGRKCALVIQSGQVTDNEVDFPALVTKDTLPSEIFDADGPYPALNGGGDIRFSSDSDGATQLSCEIEQFVTDNDPANGKAAIWVKVPSLSSTTNTTIYIWYNKAGETQPAEDAAYGKESVWDSNFMMVQHMNQDPSGGAPQMIDSTANDNDGTSGGTMLTEDLVEGQIDGALEFDGTDDYIDCGNDDSLNLIGSSTYFSWIYTSVTPAYNVILSNGIGSHTGLIQILSSKKVQVGFYNGTAWKLLTSDVYINLNTRNNIIYEFNSETSTITVIVNGVSKSLPVLGTPENNPTQNLTIGAQLSPNYFLNGYIDESRVSDSTRSAGWRETEYANQDSPGTFIIEGTPESPSAIINLFQTANIGADLYNGVLA